MATPRGGKRFFQAMGQSAASRGAGDAHANSLGQLIDDVPIWAFDAFRQAFFSQGQLPMSQVASRPVFPDRVTQQRRI